MPRVQPTRYCLTCRYPLRAAESTACPECGRAFDADDPRTTAAHPIGDGRRGLAIVGRTLGVIVGILAGAAFLSSALGVTPLLLWFVGILVTPFVIILIVITV